VVVAFTYLLETAANAGSELADTPTGILLDSRCRKAMKRVQNGKDDQFYLFEGLGKNRGDFTFAGVGQQ
jgi:hypothetical protein